MQRLEAFLSKHPLTTAKALREAGFRPHHVEQAVWGERMVRVSQGIFAHPDARLDLDYQDAVLALRTKAILFRRTQGMRLGLTTDMPPWVEALVPYEVTPPTQWSTRTLFVRTRSSRCLDIGVESRTVLGVEVRSTDPARTVIDHYRSWGDVSVPEQHVAESLHGYLDAGHSPDVLSAMARRFGPAVSDRIEIALGTILGGPSF